MKEVDLIRTREMDITKERIQKVLDAGANVILTTKGIDDLCLKVTTRPLVGCQICMPHPVV
jgi:chaperonin GroEL (HSP60 family)